MRIGYLGPEGTHTHEALLNAARATELEAVALPTVYDTVMAVRDHAVDRAVVPIENSIEGAVNATLDALAFETEEVTIVGEIVQPIHHCLIARGKLALGDVEAVLSHPQASGQCAGFLRSRLPTVPIVMASSTAEAVRLIACDATARAAIGTRLAAALYGCTVLVSGIEDSAGNETRFVWLARAGDAAVEPVAQDGPWKTAIVFWGVGAEAPGWLVTCLGEFARRGVNLTRIESRPRKQGLGRYMFFADLEGRDRDPPVADGLAAVREHVEQLRVLGSFPAA
ncbi:MAG: prephenate dehydratase [Solirubrobacteraceae bacterium]